eukprot:5815139-Alexandrium_andersonii.AAC.1
MGYSDADWAGSRRDYRSTSGRCFFVGGMLVSMASNTQPGLPGLSSGESELRSLSAAASEALYLAQ